MTTTPTSGAADLPEALRSIQRFEVVDCIDDKHVPAVIPRPHGPWVRYADHVTALAAGQATAAPVLWLSPEQFANFVDADEAPFGKYVPARKTSAGKFTMPLFAARAPAPAQPTPDERRLRRHLCATFEHLPYMDDGEAQGQSLDWLRCTVDQIDARIREVRLERLASATAQPVAEQGVAYAALPTSNYAGRVYEEGFLIGTCPLYTADQMRAFADRTHALRAAHGQAPAGATKPTEQQILEAAEKAGLWPNTVHSWIPAFHRYHKELAKAQSAPARADSVLEDAARYRLVRRGQHWSVIDGIGNDLRAEALDAAVDAARKQGEKQ